jgi:hypothetical protein
MQALLPITLLPVRPVSRSPTTGAKQADRPLHAPLPMRLYPWLTPAASYALPVSFAHCSWAQTNLRKWGRIAGFAPLTNGLQSETLSALTSESSRALTPISGHDFSLAWMSADRR